MGRQSTSCHREGGSSHICVTGHRLIDHYIVNIRIRTGSFGIAHISGNITIFQSDGVFSFNNQCFRIVCSQFCVLNGNVCGGINSGGVIAVACIGSVVNIDSSAATVRANCCRGIAGGFNCQMISVGCTASGGLNTARIVCCSCNGRVGNVDDSTFPITEYAVSVLGGRSNSRFCNSDLCAVCCKQCRIYTVEIAIFSIGGGASRLFYFYIIKRCSSSVD